MVEVTLTFYKRQGDLGNMKKVILIGMAACMLLLAGCDKQSVNDAVAIDESRAERSSKNMEEATTKESIPHTTKSWVSGRQAEIKEAKKGETIMYGGYELTLIDAWIAGDTLMPLDDITGNSQFRKYIVTRGDYDESGKYNGKTKNVKNIFIKIKLKDVAANKENENLCIAPMIFSKSSGGAYNRLLAESIGFDKNKYINNPTSTSKDDNYYQFKKDDEIETVVAIMLSGDISENDDLYLYSGFLDIYSGDGVNSVGDGSYMVKLDCKAK